MAKFKVTFTFEEGSQIAAQREVENRFAGLPYNDVKLVKCKKHTKCGPVHVFRDGEFYAGQFRYMKHALRSMRAAKAMDKNDKVTHTYTIAKPKYMTNTQG